MQSILSSFSLLSAETMAEIRGVGVGSAGAVASGVGVDFGGALYATSGVGEGRGVGIGLIARAAGVGGIKKSVSPRSSNSFNAPGAKSCPVSGP